MDHDPYFAGRPHTTKSPDEPNPLIVGWVFVYILNLIVPLFLAMFVTDKAGKLGMTAAIVALLGLGCLVVPRCRHAGKAVVIGGGFTALLQFFPPLPMLAGTIGVAVARDMGQTLGGDQIASEFGGFVATVVTGGVLIAVALVIGWTVQGVSAWIAGERVGGRPSKGAGPEEIV